MSVFLTGGSGVVGAAVLRHLVDAGEDVHALSRSEASDRRLAGAGARPVRGDVFDDLTPVIDGCTHVYHVAGVNEMCSRDPGRMTRVNVEGSLNVLRCAERAGVSRLIYTSSATALGEPDGTIGSESSPHRGYYLSNYERSKHLAEMAVLAEESGVDVVSVNPSSVQGPGRATGTGKLILDLVRGRLPALVETNLSIVGIDDCARGHLLAASKGVPGERYVLNSFTIGMHDAVDLLATVIGRPVTARFVPGAVAKLGASLIEGAYWMARRRPPVCREMVATMLHGHQYDGSRAERELGLDYATASDLLGELVGWYRSEGLLDE